MGLNAFNVPLRLVLPYALLPISCIASLASPRFRGRGVIWTIIIIYIAYLTQITDWPPDTQMRYGLRQAWFTYVPTITYLLFSEPELTYWRLDKQPMEAANMRGFGWDKIRWAGALWVNPRGVGWSHRLKHFPTADYMQGATSWFLARQAISLFWHLLLLDACLMSLRYLKYLDGKSIEEFSALRWATIQTVITVITYTTWYFQWLGVSIMSVALGLSEPKDWPPFFNNIAECVTVARYWGTYWHQALRNPVMACGHFLVDTFRIRRGSNVARVVYLLTSFIISGFFHAMSFSNLGGSVKSSHVYRVTIFFFIVQVVGILIETVAIGIYNGVRRANKGHASPFVEHLCLIFERYVGYVWVWVWLYVSGHSYADMIMRTDIAHWKAPLRTAFLLFGNPPL